MRAPGPELDEVVVVVDLGQQEEALGNLAELEHLEGVLAAATEVVTGFLDQGLAVRLLTRHVDGFYRAEREQALADPTREPWTVMTPADVGERSLVDRVVTDRDELVRRISTADVGPPIAGPAQGYVRVDRNGVRVC